MTREIKFRAFIKPLKEWWDLAGFVIDSNREKIRLYRMNDEFPDGMGTELYMLEDVEIVEYTGLKDKNDKEIYEGDIVVQDCYLWFDDGKPNYRGTVEWVFSQWQVIAHCVNPGKKGISDGVNEGINDDGVPEGDKSDWEVIGNIHQNPELLTEDLPEKEHGCCPPVEPAPPPPNEVREDGRA